MSLSSIMPIDDLDAGGTHAPDVGLGRGDLLERSRQIVHGRSDDRNPGRAILPRPVQPSSHRRERSSVTGTRASRSMTWRMSLRPLRRGRADTAALEAQAREQLHRSASEGRRHCAARRRRRCGIRWDYGRPAARAPRARPRCSAATGRRIATQAPPLRAGHCGTGCEPTSASRLPCRAPVFAELDELELPRRSDRVHVGAGIDHCALASKNTLAGDWARRSHASLRRRD